MSLHINSRKLVRFQCKEDCTSFYQINKRTDISVETFDDSSINILRRSPNFREYCGGNVYGTRLYDFPSAGVKF